MNKEEYLGDGLYASFDGFQFTLRAPRGLESHYVCLDDHTMNAFVEYARRTLAPFDAEKRFGV